MGPTWSLVNFSLRDHRSGSVFMKNFEESTKVTRQFQRLVTRSDYVTEVPRRLFQYHSKTDPTYAVSVPPSREPETPLCPD